MTQTELAPPPFAVSGEDGAPVHHRGIVSTAPGLYFVGLFFLYSLASPLVAGVGRDAQHVAEHIASRVDGSDPERRS